MEAGTIEGLNTLVDEKLGAVHPGQRAHRRHARRPTPAKPEPDAAETSGHASEVGTQA